MMYVVILTLFLAWGIGPVAAFVISFVFVVSGILRGAGFFPVLEAVRAFTVCVGQAGDLGRRE